MTTLVVFMGGAGGLFLLSRGEGDVWGGPYRGKDTRAGCLKPGILPCPGPSLLVAPLLGSQFLLVLLKRAVPELGSAAPGQPK